MTSGRRGKQLSIKLTAAWVTLAVLCTEKTRNKSSIKFAGMSDMICVERHQASYLTPGLIVFSRQKRKSQGAGSGPAALHLVCGHTSSTHCLHWCPCSACLKSNKESGSVVAVWYELDALTLVCFLPVGSADCLSVLTCTMWLTSLWSQISVVTFNEYSVIKTDVGQN